MPCTFSFISLFIAFTFSYILQPYSTISVSILITSVLNCVPDRLAISSSRSCIFSGALICSFIWAIFFCCCFCVPFTLVRGRALGIYQGRATHVSVVMLYFGEGSEKGWCHLLSSRWLSVTSFATHKQIGPFWCWFPGGWACVCSSTLWVSAMDSPVRLEVSPAATNSIGFSSQRFWGLISLHWNPGLCGLSYSPVVPPSLSVLECGKSSLCLTCPSPLLPFHTSSPPQLPVSAPLTSLDECFFFNSLVVRLPYSLFFWLFFVFKFVVLLLLVVRGDKVYLSMPPSWPEV